MRAFLAYICSASLLFAASPIPFNPQSRTVVAAGGGGTPTFIQDDGASFDPFNTTRAVTFGSSTTSGSCIIAIYRGVNADTLSCSDNKGNTYTSRLVNGTTSNISIIAAYNITGGASHQVTFTLGTTNPNPGDIVVMEFSNVAAASAFDQSCEDSQFTANISCTTGTTTQAIELVIGACSRNTATAGSGFTLRIVQGGLATESKTVAATGAQTVAFVNTEATVGISAATFKGN